MLPFRFLRTVNSVARSQTLRSLSSLPPPRLSSTVRHNSTRVPPVSTFASAPSTAASDAQAARSDGDEPKLSLTFTCTAGSCTTRSTHQFTKRAYEKGIVLIECPGCKTRHLIADNLGWFKDSTKDGKMRNVEDLLRARGETVRRGRLNPDGSIEVNE